MPPELRHNNLRRQIAHEPSDLMTWLELPARVHLLIYWITGVPPAVLSLKMMGHLEKAP